MRKLAVLLVLVSTLFSCTPEDECGFVTDWDIGYNGELYLWVDGNRHNVKAGTWYEYNIGDYICVEY